MSAKELKLQQNKKGRNLFEMPTKDDVFFSAVSCKKDIVLVGISNKLWHFLFR